jgi:transposase InsO family protein
MRPFGNPGQYPGDRARKLHDRQRMPAPSITLFCVSALQEALARFGRPEIFNTDQGSQFTSAAFTGVLRAAGVRISMDGRGRRAAVALA